MTIDARGARRVMAAGAVALLLAGCGGTDEAAVTTPSSSASVDAAGGELAGVQVDVRRDPG